MKFLKALLPVIMLFVTLTASAQKVKIKKNTVSIDKVEICKVEKDDVSRGAFYINDLNNEQRLYCKWIDITKSYAEYGYYEIYKADDLKNVLFEEPSGIGFRKWLIKRLYKAKVFEASGINQEKLDNFAVKVGKEFSRQRSENRY